MELNEQQSAAYNLALHRLDGKPLNVEQQEKLAEEYVALYRLVTTPVGELAGKKKEPPFAPSGTNEGSDADRIKKYVLSHPNGIAPDEITAALGVSRNQADVALKRLTEDGLIHRVVRGFYRPYEDSIA